MRVYDQALTLRLPPLGRSHLAHLDEALRFRFGGAAHMTRVSVVASDQTKFDCEISVVDGIEDHYRKNFDSILNFRRRKAHNARQFNVVLVVPTGIGAEIGGHAGDATPVARLISDMCDTLVTHPNVVNASDINELPDQALYVEGSILSRLLMGTVGLVRVPSNRVLVLIDGQVPKFFISAAINAVNAARSSFGLKCNDVIVLDSPIRMESQYSPTGRATGEINNLDHLLNVLDHLRDQYDAIALSSVIKVPHYFHARYFEEQGRMVNPWGGVEALLTHTLSSILNKPTAHSPMLECEEIANMDPGVVDARMAAEAISTTYLPCILKGLHRSPSIVTDSAMMVNDSIFSVEDVSCLVIPDGVIGIPTLAALEQGIPVIAVRENANLMRNDLTTLPWSSGQLFVVENYWEAVGVLAALREGIDPHSVRRPMSTLNARSSHSIAAAIEPAVSTSKTGLDFSNSVDIAKKV